MADYLRSDSDSSPLQLQNYSTECTTEISPVLQAIEAMKYVKVKLDPDA